MNEILIRNSEDEVIAKIEINAKTPSESIDLISNHIKDDVKAIIYPAGMPDSNGFLNNLKSNLATLQKVGFFENVELIESSMVEWVKGGYGKVDIETEAYWVARGFAGDIADHIETIDKYGQVIKAVKAMNVHLHEVGLLKKGLTFGQYCYTLTSLKDD